MGRRLVYIRPAATAYNPLTTAWIAATGETDTTILNALNTFEAGLDANSLIPKFTAIYPMVGGTDIKHRYNFINTALYPLSFLGGWTHSATGALPSGTNGNASTGIGGSNLTVNSNHISFYSRTNAAVAAKPSIGLFQSPLALLLYLKANGAGNAIYSNTGTSLATMYPSGASTDSRGWFIGNKSSNAIGGLTISKNGTSLASNTAAPNQTAYPNLPVLISGNSVGGAIVYDDKECAMVTIGTSLTSGEISTLYTLIQAFQTNLNTTPPRQV